jgi:hypothetical protein
MENMENCNIDINFYGDKKTFKLSETYDLFKKDICSEIGIEEEYLNNLNIFYNDKDNIHKNINNSEDYNDFFVKVLINEAKSLEIEYKSEENSNANDDNFILNLNDSENKNNINIFNCNNNNLNDNDNNLNNNDINNLNNENDIFNNSNNNENNNSNIKDEIVYPVTCNLCKEYNLNNIIYYCKECENYICEKCFKKTFREHIHSYNVIGNMIHFNYFNHENLNKNENKEINIGFDNKENDNIYNLNENNNNILNDNNNNLIIGIHNDEKNNNDIIMNDISNNNIQNNEVEKNKKENINNNEFTPIDYTKDDWGICPITNEFMENPVITIYGTHYEKTAIIDWLSRNQRDPLTNQPLTINDLTDDEEYKRNIKEYRFVHDI